MTKEEAKREMMFAKRNVIADSWIDKAYDMAIKALAQPEIVRCKDCRYNRDCNIQYHAQAGEEFYCGAAERRADE